VFMRITVITCQIIVSCNAPDNCTLSQPKKRILKSKNRLKKNGSKVSG
jgi:hypothetical protein